MSNRNTDLFGKSIAQEKQVALFSLGLNPDHVIILSDGYRNMNAYYYHFNYSKPQELSALARRFVILGLKYKLVAKISNLDTLYTAIYFFYIPAIYIKYLKSGASASMKLRFGSDSLMLF